MMNSDGYYIDLDPKWFNKGSFDNCTPKHLLTYRLEPSRFTCDTRGRQDVRMYVKDQDGNEQYCNTYVIIQDNMGMCPPIDTTTFTLSGQLTNVQGETIQGIDIELMQNGDMMKENKSDATGAFEFIVMNSEDYMIIPRGDQEYALGLSTFDLLKLAKHIYGVKTLDLDAELLAADADQNNDVNVQDLLLLRKLLLNYTNKLPNNKAWRFIPTEILNANNSDPLQMIYDEYWQAEDLDHDVNNIDFTAIKIGDINGSIQGFNAAEERRSQLKIEVEAVQNGNVVSFISKQSLNVIGCQMELNFGNRSIKNIIEGKFNCSLAHANILENTTLISWFLVEGDARVKEGDVLFSIELHSDEVLNLALLNKVLSPELYSAGELVFEIELSSKLKSVEENVTVLNTEISVFPNPVKFNEVIQIVSLDSKIERVSVFNSQGLPVFNVLSVDGSELSVPTRELKTGLYLIQVKTIDGEEKLERVIVEK